MPPDKPDPNPEIADLADAIGEDPVPDVDAPQPQPKPAAEEEKDKPPGDPDTSGKKEGETDEEATAREAEEAAKGKPKDGDTPPDEDPLKGVELKALLEHPVLGPALQRWSDLAGNTRINTAIDRERESITTSAQRTAEEKQADEHFASMTKEQIAEEISENSDAAVAYAQHEARLKAGASAPVSPQAVARASSLYAISSQVQLNIHMLEGSDLSTEVKDGLKPENYNQPGGEGLNAWGEAIYKAIVTQEAQKLAEGLKEEQWETFKQEHLVDLDGDRPDTTGGRKAATVPDLMTTSTDKLWDGAFEGRPLDKEGAK